MIPEKFINYFIPFYQQNKLYPKYDQVRTIVSGMVTAALLLFILPIPLFFFFKFSIVYYLMAIMCVITLFIIKKTGSFLIATICTFIFSYIVLTFIIIISGGVYSVHLVTLYILMLTGFWADRNIGYAMTFINVIILLFIHYMMSIDDINYNLYISTVGSQEYSVLFHTCLTLFFAAFFVFVQESHDVAKVEIRKSQILEIKLLTETLEKRNNELKVMRQSIASDFHDETGNVLAEISQQVSVLKLKVNDQEALIPMLESISTNCDQLFASSKDFLWSINNDNNDPLELFSHLTSFGQHFYNQFEIGFSATPLDRAYSNTFQMAPFASRNLIYIIKEAMTNTAKHANASLVDMEMTVRDGYIKIRFSDNGTWKAMNELNSNNGLNNMERRSKNNDFIFTRNNDMWGTHIEVEVPVIVRSSSNFTDTNKQNNT